MCILTWTDIALSCPSNPSDEEALGRNNEVRNVLTILDSFHLKRQMNVKLGVTYQNFHWFRSSM